MRERFENCLLNGRIVPMMPDWDYILLELSEADRDLAASQRADAHHDCKWAIITAYSSMYHSYRSLIMVKGYQEKSESCLRDALDALYVEEGALDPALLAGFREAKHLYNQALYDGVYSEPSSKWILESAKAIREAVRGLIPVDPF
ncbi:HEPN domain-containing protein [Methanospirillum lacunae]